MDFTSFKDIKYYKECAALVEGMGYRLVELKIIPAKTITKISAMISSPDPAVNLGVSDCAKVHRVLLPRLEALLGTDETSMELTSPGIEHNLKNAAEFTVFTGYNIRVWDKTINDWNGGKVLSADDKSVTMEKEGGETFTVLYENIAKAKFIYSK